jgi:hypothetical protein
MHEFAHALGEFTVLYCTVCVMTFRLDATAPSQAAHRDATPPRQMKRGTLLRFPNAQGSRAS